jgi:hypothetical protein
MSEEITDTPEATPEETPGEGKSLPGETANQREKRLLETTVNGRKVKIDEETLLKDYSKYSAADEKFREAAELRPRGVFKRRADTKGEAARDRRKDLDART